MTQGTGQESELRREDIRQGTILMSPQENLRCQVDRIDGDSAHIRVLDNKTYNNQREFTMPVNDLINEHWQLTRKAA